METAQGGAMVASNMLTTPLSPDLLAMGHVPACRFYLEPEIQWCWCPAVVEMRRHPQWYAAAFNSILDGRAALSAILEALVEIPTPPWKMRIWRWVDRLIGHSSTSSPTGAGDYDLVCRRCGMVE